MYDVKQLYPELRTTEMFAVHAPASPEQALRVTTNVEEHFVKMDMIITEDEENIVVKEDTLIGENNATRNCQDIYEYEDVHDRTKNETTDDVPHHSVSSRSSDMRTMMNQISEHSSRRRINVIAASTSGGVAVLMRKHQRVVWYSPPRQRQKWGDSQVLPRVNWFDLFFDLFYVGATYNVSSILYNSPNGRGLLYAAGTFLPVMTIWSDRTYYEARFAMEDDVFHRCSTILGFTLVGFIIANIRTVDILSDARNESSMFLFALLLLAERIFASLLYAETYFYGVGQPKQIKSAAIRNCMYSNYASPFYAAAMIIAALKYFGKVGTNRRFTADTASYTGISSDENTDLPIALCLIGCSLKLLSYTIMIIFCLPKDGSHKEVAVPINIDFMIHRSGEWMMLMLGESIFSLLIVDVKDKGFDFYLVFYFSLLTVVLVQLLHFHSEPHQADLHAVRRNKNAGMLWSSIQYVYSLSLVTMGASYTFFLLNAEDSDERRRLILRQLASASGASGSDLVGAAHLYSGALAVVFLCLTIMNFLHKSPEERKYAATFAIALRIAIVAVAATISQWTFEPKFITLTGMLCVIADLFSRKIESIHNKKNRSTKKVTTPHVNEDESEEASWPNVMHAGVSLEPTDMSKQIPVS